MKTRYVVVSWCGAALMLVGLSLAIYGLWEESTKSHYPTSGDVKKAITDEGYSFLEIDSTYTSNMVEHGCEKDANKAFIVKVETDSKKVKYVLVCYYGKEGYTIQPKNVDWALELLKNLYTTSTYTEILTDSKTSTDDTTDLGDAGILRDKIQLNELPKDTNRSTNIRL